MFILMTHFFELNEKTKPITTKTLFLLRILSLWVSYLSWPHTYHLAARQGFEKHSLSIKGLFNLPQKARCKGFYPTGFPQDTAVQQNWNLYLIVNLLQLAHF